MKQNPDTRLPKIPRIELYSVLLTQTASAAPTVMKVLQKTTDAEFTWNRENTGTYNLISDTEIFEPTPHNWASITNSQNIPDISIVVEYISPTNLRVTTYNATPSPTDALLSNTFLEIRIYNEKN